MGLRPIFALSQIYRPVFDDIPGVPLRLSTRQELGHRFRAPAVSLSCLGQMGVCVSRQGYILANLSSSSSWFQQIDPLSIYDSTTASMTHFSAQYHQAHLILPQSEPCLRQSTIWGNLGIFGLSCWTTPIIPGRTSKGQDACGGHKLAQ